VHCQYVWDLRYIDSPVLRDEDLDSDGDCTDDEGTGSERLCYANDANFNVTALVETDGAVAERTIYDAYGQPTLYDATWTSTIAESTSKANELRFCGYVYDPIVGLYHVRHRTYHPTLGRWVQRDPAGYVDGMVLGQYVASNPVKYSDPTGKEKDYFDCQERCEKGGHWGAVTACIERCMDETGLNKRPRNRYKRLKVPSFRLAPGLSGSVAFYAPPLPPLPGVYVEVKGTEKRGTCCQDGQKRYFVKHSASATVGVYKGTPRFKKRVTVPLVEFKKECPSSQRWTCHGVFTVGVRISLVTMSCTWKRGSGWSCGAGIRLRMSDIASGRVKFGGGVECSRTLLSDRPIP
jgi:RHS repeat-associated protein